MKHALISIIAPIPIDQVDTVRTQIEQTMGNPANDAVRAALQDDETLHFASMHALAGSDGKRGSILLEFTADGDADSAIRHIATVLSAQLLAIFIHASDWRQDMNLAGYLRNHEVKPGFGLMDQPGLNFDGTPGMSVVRIRREAALRRMIVSEIEMLPLTLGPMEQVQAIRKIIGADPNFAWALEPPPPVSRDGKSGKTGVARVVAVIGTATATFLWPLLILLLLSALLSAIQQSGFYAMRMAAWSVLWKGGLAVLGIGIVALAFIAIRLLRAEKTDWVSDRSASPSERKAMLERENSVFQNHMISITVRKPGFIRRCTSHISFFAIGTLTALNGRPGFLGEIGTIHFARWITIPGTRDLIFASNYDGSWESYLEDFITKAHEGLTGAWSNTVGFPRTKLLFLDGASDGDRFKRFARHSMIRTSFWYSAYPGISTDNIRTNTNVHRGLALAESDEEATRWLALLGSAVRPLDKLESGQIQSLVFGGLGFLPLGVCMMLDLGDDRDTSIEWLRKVKDYVAFGDGRKYKNDAVISLAMSVGAIRKLGLDASAIETFPPAFVDGMTSPGRGRILGDPDIDTRRKSWSWGAEREPDIALLIYAKGTPELTRLRKIMERLSKVAGHSIVKIIPLSPIPNDKTKRTEPFGFLDGVSQPLIKGSFKAAKAERETDTLHLVEPGEFILGYPDNRGNLPPSPHLKAELDAEQRLAIGDGQWDFDAPIECVRRDLGRNGSFLVIRQIDQHVNAFDTYCAAATKTLEDRFGNDVDVSAEFVGAKMIGRWKDGSSIIRWPYQSASSFYGEAKSPDNDFHFGTEDPEGTRCPFGAHIRRANPRESQKPGSDEQIAISNRHRILRVGRAYEDNGAQGLLFMCLNGDIERQFEFIQQTWALSGHFHGLDGEADPILATNGPESRFTVPNRAGPVRLKAMPNFVTTRGGGYYFLPGKRFINYLAQS
jgi:deferrochelatase/peroxidase EfeB